MKLGLRLLGKLMWRLVLLAWEKAIRGTGGGPEGDRRGTSLFLSAPIYQILKPYKLGVAGVDRNREAI